MFRHRHLDDERLLSAWIAPDPAADARVLAHVRECPHCADRLRYLSERLETDRHAARLEVAGRFSAEQLAAQRARIMRRIEVAGRPARVIEFPARTLHAPVSGRPRVALRWVAAAAVVGLVAGLGAGMVVDQRFARGGTAADARLAQDPSPVLEAPAAPVVRTAGLTEDDLLGDIDAALGSPLAPELQALDAFTPPVLEVAYTLR